MKEILHLDQEFEGDWGTRVKKFHIMLWKLLKKTLYGTKYVTCLRLYIKQVTEHYMDQMGNHQPIIICAWRFILDASKYKKFNFNPPMPVNIKEYKNGPIWKGRCKHNCMWATLIICLFSLIKNVLMGIIWKLAGNDKSSKSELSGHFLKKLSHKFFLSINSTHLLKNPIAW